MSANDEQDRQLVRELAERAQHEAADAIEQRLPPLPGQGILDALNRARARGDVSQWHRIDT